MATARYVGVPIVELLDDGRRVRLVQPFGFNDAGGIDWPVPAGIVVDGASIPSPLWPLIGGPFEGRFRNASIIHDHYCDLANRPWRAVHRVFYDAMRVSGVGRGKAKLMYFAVDRFGPRWPDPDSGLESTVAAPPPFDPAEIAAVAAMIRERDPPADELARMAESFAPPR